jgi:hypothetical protein
MENQKNEIDKKIEKDNLDWQKTLTFLLNNQTIKSAIQTVLKLMEQSVENQKRQTDLSKTQLENQIELRKLDIQEQELDIKSEELENKHLKNIDLINKGYSIVVLSIVITGIFLLRHLKVLGTSEVKIIMVLCLGSLWSSNKDFVRNLYRKK